MERAIAIEAGVPEKRGNAMWPDQLGALFEAHHLLLYRVARRLCRDPEESHDLVQESFLRAARHPEALSKEGADPEAWLVRVMVNLCRDRVRRLQVRRNTPEDRLPGPRAEADPEAAAVARATVQSALARLTPRRRAVIALCELEQLPASRVATLLGLRPVTVRWHLTAARKELARILGTGVMEGSETPQVKRATEDAR